MNLARNYTGTGRLTLYYDSVEELGRLACFKCLFFVSSRITSKSSMHVAFTLMRGNLKSDTESLKRFRIALKRKMTIENTRQQGIEVSYFYYKIY